MTNTKRDGNFVPGGDIGVIQQLDLTTKWPQTVAILDGSGNQVTSFGGGTQYTDGGTPPANPVAPTIQWNEGGTWRTVSTAKPLPVTATISTAGLATTATDTSTASIDTKTPALGQALAAASTPVVLTAAQLTTLTPPAAITGFATSAKQDTGNTSLGSIDGKLPALGQALAAASVPVILPSATITTLTPPAAITGFATESTLSTLNGKVTAVNTGAVVVSSSALPTGAATAAKQPALGTAGTPSADVISVQGVASMTALKVDGSGVTQPVSGTVSITANSAVNIAQMNGVATTMGNGVSGTGVQRVTIASDSTGVVSLATGSNTIGALTANQSVNNAQINGVTPLMGNGVTGTGSQRVTIASDNTAFAVNSTLQTQTDTVMIGGVNVKEINAVAPLMGNGVTGTGSLRVTLASDTTANSNPFLIAGGVANAASDSGNPVKIGGVGRTANPTAVTDGQRVNATYDKLGKMVVVNSIRDLKGVQQTTITSSTAETTIVTAVASTFLDLYGLIITNTSATVTKVTIKDSTAGTTRAVIEIPATETRGFMLTESAAIPQATVNTAWTATCGTSVASVEITALYVKNI